MHIPTNYSAGAYRALEAARNEARMLGRGHVGTEHLLLALANRDDSIGSTALRRAGVDIERLRRAVGSIKGRTNGARVHLKAAGRMVGYTQLLQRVIVQGGRECAAFNHTHISVDHLWLGLLRSDSGVVRRVLHSLKVDPEIIRSEVVNVLRPVQMLVGDAGAGLPADPRGAAGEISSNADTPEQGAPEQAQAGQPQSGQPQAVSRPGAKQPSLLVALGRDLTELARAGKLDPVIGRDEVIARMCDILCLRKKNNVALVGEAGVGKTAIVEGLAQRIAKGDVPEMLLNRVIIELTPASLVSGTKYRGEFESRMRLLLEEIRRRPEVIVFFDEMHTLMGAGRAEGSADAANILKPALSRDGIRSIGATTEEEYDRFIAKDEALERRYYKVKVDEPTIGDTIRILERLRPLHQAHHGVEITDAALEAAAKLSARFIKNRQLPDKAIDVLDEAGVYARRTNQAGHSEATRLAAEIEDVRARINRALVDRDPGTAATLRKEELKLADRLAHARMASASARPIVTEEAVAAVISSITKIPLGHIDPKSGARLITLAAEFSKAVIGQEFACEAVATALRRSRGGVRDPRRPAGAMLFLGPTGVGKTELAKQLAKEFSGDQNAFVQLDMSEFMEKASVTNLIGGPQGYVGYEEGGRLTNEVRRHPYAVVLVDEIEKAAPEVLQIFLQVLEEGRLTDASGRVVDFSNTIVVFTSNVGASVLLSPPRAMGFAAAAAARDAANAAEEYEQLRQRGLEEARKVFKPEFLNRVNDVVVFRPLNKEDFACILDLQIRNYAALALDQKRITLLFDERLKEHIFALLQETRYGAREVRRTVERLVGDGLNNAILSNQVAAGDTVVVSVASGAVIFRRAANAAPRRAVPPPAPATPA